MDVPVAPPPLSAEMQRYAALDQRLLVAVRAIRILPTVAWSASLEERMIAEYRVDRLSLPDVHYVRPDLDATRRELVAIEKEVAEDHPIADYLRRTAESWRVAAEMLEKVGTAGFAEPSIQLYGRPGELIPGSPRSNLDAARYFVELADELGADLATDDAEGNIPAEALRADMAAKLDAFFGPGRISVEVDPELTAKAAAGATRIRLRGGASFTEYDRHQLLAHEAFVHTLTALNGREQPMLASLARTSPRVTATQEGLA
ncbi:MAG TPA: tyrosine/phenylalanine carboxypeptidase domain-containing protein, partial [Luteibacter sp.]|nr:tyrosine/phenylalanine carboxypeptidase domain-containing protein [Luteibacter sp.]